MKIQEPEITELILRRMQGKITDLEERLLMQWIEENPEQAGVLEEYQKIWKGTEVKEPEFEPDVDAAWQKVKIKANLTASHASTIPGSGKVISINLVWKVAAAFIILMGLGYLTFKNVFNTETLIEVTALNSPREVTLPDGSKVTLNKNSSLKYAEEFDSEAREVFLDGEAFFKVERDTKRPFKVFGTYSVTEVLGTSFNIKAYKETEEETIHVLTGKVAFSAKGQTEKLVLTPGNSARCTSSGSIEKQKSVASDNSVAWKTRELKFIDEDLAKVCQDLEAYFGRPVLMAKDLEGQRFTGSFRDPELEEVLMVIAVSIDAEVNVKDSIYNLVKQVPK